MSAVVMFFMIFMAMTSIMTAMEQPSEAVTFVRVAAAFAEMGFVHHVDHFVMKMKPHFMEYYMSDIFSDVGKKI